MGGRSRVIGVLGQNLRRWRDHQGRTLKQLSDRLGDWLRKIVPSESSETGFATRYVEYGLRKPQFSLQLLGKMERKSEGSPPYVRALLDFLREEEGLASDSLRSAEAGPHALIADRPNWFQIPCPPADFTGRTADIDDLRAAIAAGFRILALQGMGGIGKSVLGRKVAEMVSTEYPDAGIFLNLKGVDPSPLTSAEIMQHVIRAFRPSEPMPPTDADLFGTYQSVLKDRRAIIFFDNVAGAEQVAELLPPPSALCLLTSRQRFTLPGLHAIDLDVLLPRDCVRLITRIAPRVGKLALPLAELCGFLALAIRVSASLIEFRRDVEVRSYLKDLHRTREHLESIDSTTGLSVVASIKLSYGLLSSPLQGRWRKLAVFAGSFDASAAAAACRTRKLEMGASLGELMRYSLVNWDERSSRYSLHDLARQVANEYLGQ